MKKPPQRISLAEASRRTGALMRRGDPTPAGAQRQPQLEDITECLFFSPGDGRIWLNDQRMMLMHSASLGTLRRELIETLGLERARGLLTRAGYESGARDARLVRERWPEGDLVSVFLAGTRLHALEGVVKVIPVEFDIDPEHGRYHGEFLWQHSMEDDEHISAYGLGTEPACWMQTGYATGYVTGLMGRLVVFREVECRSTGQAECRVIGKTADAWGDVSEDLRYLNAQDFLSTDTHHSGSQPVLGGKPSVPEVDGQMVGVSSAFKAACHMLTRVASTKATVLFTGESGVGKEMFASTLHRIGNRSDKPFVAINCAAIPEALVESELFGVERGAFTGASVSHVGLFERANGGTVFLDEIGEISPAFQVKLLRVLQSGEIRPVGASKPMKVDVRVIAATNKTLEEEVRRGRFREDLFYRLDVYPIHLPPLRERREDIPLLMSHFLHVYSQQHGRRLMGYAPRAVKALLGYDFPGNIRELQNLVERGVISADEGGVIDLPHMLRREQMGANGLLALGAAGSLSKAAGFGPDSGGTAPAVKASDPDDGAMRTDATGLREEAPSLPLPELQLRLMQDAVQRSRGNLSAAARLLGITRAQLAYRLKVAQRPSGG